MPGGVLDAEVRVAQLIRLARPVAGVGKGRPQRRRQAGLGRLDRAVVEEMDIEALASFEFFCGVMAVGRSLGWGPFIGQQAVGNGPLSPEKLLEGFCADCGVCFSVLSRKMQTNDLAVLEADQWRSRIAVQAGSVMGQQHSGRRRLHHFAWSKSLHFVEIAEISRLIVGVVPRVVCR